VEDGLMFQTLLGVTGSGKTYTMANVIARMGRPALVLAPNKTLAAQLYAEFREFFPENAVEYFVSYYDYYQPEAYVPSRDLFIEKDSSINEHIEQMRLSATKSLLERATWSSWPRCRASTASAIRSITTHDPAPARRRASMAQRDLHPAPGGDAVRAQRHRLPPRHLPRARRRDRRLPGRKRRARAVRIEMFDDEIEHLTLFDPLTGHLKQKLALHVYPVQPLRDAARHGAAGDRGDQGGAARAHRVLPAQQGKLVEAQRIEQRTRFDLEMLEQMGFCKGIENYSRHLSGRGPASRRRR
jgi:excinuclease ABC subunit B